MSANGDSTIEMNERVESADPEIVFQVRDNVDGNEIGQGDIHARHEDRGEGAEFYPKDRTGTDRVFNADFRDQAPIYPEFHGHPNEPRFRQNQIPGTTIKPEPYNGRESWEEYISYFENCVELGRWNEVDKVLLLSASLRGQARTFYISLTATEKKSYHLLIKTLEQRFGNARHQNRWLSRFETRTRKLNESIATFGDDLRQMAQKAYSNLDTRAQEVLALNQLYKNISLEMKCRCIDKECHSVTEAVDLIERYEALLGESSDRKRGNVRQVMETRNPLLAGNNNDNSANGALIRQLFDRIEKLEHGSGQAKRTCFNCNSPDHFYRNCPNNRDQTSYDRQFVQKRPWQRNPTPTSYSGHDQRQNRTQQNQGNENPSARQAGARRN